MPHFSKRSLNSRVQLIALLIVVLAAPVVFGQTVRQEEFTPLRAEWLAQGGSLTAVADGYSALMSNPAGIPDTQGTQLTLPAFSLWAHTRPDLLLRTIGAISGQDLGSNTQQEAILDVLTQQFTTNGFGVGTALALGWVGSRAALGLEVAVDSYIYGDTFPLGLEGELDSHIALAIGYGQPFVLGPVDLSLGVALRPHVRVNSFITSSGALALLSQFIGINTGGSSDPLQSISALNGFGVAFDAGARARYGSITLAVQARNLLNTNLEYTNNSLQTIVDKLVVGALPDAARVGDAAYVAETYINPFELTLGLAWQPDLGVISALVDPELHAEVVDPLGWADLDPARPRSLWTRLHFGTEIRVLRFVDLRAGINQGYLTAGFGMQLAFLQINYAIYGRELGRYPGDQRASGVALEVAFRF